MSRLAGAGGAAECALMNAQTYAKRGEWLCGNDLQRHGQSLQAKCGAIKTYSFFLQALFNWVKGLKMVLVDFAFFVTIAHTE